MTERLTPVVLPAGAPTRSPALLLGVAVAAVVLLLGNAVALAGFPFAAPVEQLYALGIGADLLAIAVACGVGAFVARRGYPLRPRTPVSLLALLLAGAGFVAWLVLGGIASIVQLAGPEGGRYLYATSGAFFGGWLWVLGAVFGAHAYRRGGERRNNGFAIAALAVAGTVALYAVLSAVLYGLGLTD